MKVNVKKSSNLMNDFIKKIYLWYRWWDSNPHDFSPDFESGASTNSATSAYKIKKTKLKHLVSALILVAEVGLEPTTFGL